MGSTSGKTYPGKASEQPKTSGWVSIVAGQTRRSQPHTCPIKPRLSGGLRDFEPGGNFFHGAFLCHARLNGLLQIPGKSLDRLHKFCVSLLLAVDLLRIWS